MSNATTKKNVMVVVKMQNSPSRGPVWRVCVFVDGIKFIRPGFKKRKSAINLAAMVVQQNLVHGWNVNWKVTDEKGHAIDLNLAALGNKMQRGERKNHNARKTS
jgi:hypothetical protein